MLACGAVSKVYAFEPDSEFRSVLKARIGDTAMVFSSALSDTEGRVSLFRSDVSALQTATTAGSGESSEIVEAKRLDDWCREADVSPPLFIKIDVDGAEHKVLAGALETLSRCPILLHLETRDSSALGILDEMNFRGVSISDWYGVPKIGVLGSAENHLLTNAQIRVPIIDR
jgi:FkbM family methyltransferase